MKKLLYAATALAIFAGCSKDLNEAPAAVSGTKGNTLELNLTVAEDSRAIFDGDSHIKWEKYDQLSVLLVDGATNETAINGAVKLDFGGDNEKPVFSGKLDELPDGLLDSYHIFGLYPASADADGSSYYKKNITGRSVKMIAEQVPTQTEWDGKADVMLIEPIEITLTDKERYFDRYNYDYYYRCNASAEIKFAHIFGFGCLTFASLPEEIANETVKKVVITAVGEKTDLAGTMLVDLNKNVFDNDFEVKASAPSNSITLASDNTIALKDYKAWFVANTGTYDVKVQVYTPGYTISFERKGLKIERSKITSPVINFKASSDVTESTSIDLTGGKLWQHDTDTSYKNNGNKDTDFFTSQHREANWGTLEGVPTMEYTIYGESNGSSSTVASVSPSSTTFGKRTVQRLSFSNIMYGNVVIASSSTYKGINGIKVNSGIYSGTDECDISAFIVDNNGNKISLGDAQRVIGDSDNKAGTDYYFAPAEPVQEGKLQIVFNNGSVNSIYYVYIGQLTINPEPGISFGEKSISLSGKAETKTVGLNVVCATEEAKVTSDAGWLHIDSYKDGIITYSVDANESNDIRTGHIIVEATGNSTSTKKLTISQRSINFTEFKLSFGQADVLAAIEKAKEDAEAAGDKVVIGTAMNFNTTLKATAIDGSGATKDIELSFEGVEYSSTTKDYLVMLYGKGSIRNITPIAIVTGVSVTVNQSSAGDFYVYLGATKESIDNKEKLADLNRGGSYPQYIWSGAVSESEKYGFFHYISKYTQNIYSFEITFLTSNK